MPTLTTFWFGDTDFRGSAEVVSVVEHSLSARVPRGDLDHNRSALIMQRSDSEERHDLTHDINLLGKPTIQRCIDTVNTQLAPNGLEVTHTDDWMINVGWRQWRHIAGPTKEPGRTPPSHSDDDLLVRVYFDVHINTPWWAAAVDARLEIYVWVSLVSGRVTCRIDAYDVFTWGGSVLDARVDGALKGVLGDTVNGQEVKSILTILQNSLPSRYSQLYLIPGDGNPTASGSVNGEERVTLGLLPVTITNPFRTPLRALSPEARHL